VKEVHLNKLILTKNQLQTLPEGFEHLQCLTHLDLSHNQFQELPASVGHLNFLEFLDISHNDIGIIPEDFCKLSKLLSNATHGTVLINRSLISLKLIRVI